MLSNTIENAQKKIEGINFNRRKNVLQYDDVMNQQREVIYNERYKVLNGENLKNNFIKMIEGVADYITELYCKENPYPENWDWKGIKTYAESALLPAGSLKYEEYDMESMSVDNLKRS